MKKLIVLLCILCISAGGCASFKTPPWTQNDIDRIKAHDVEGHPLGMWEF